MRITPHSSSDIPPEYCWDTTDWRAELNSYQASKPGCHWLSTASRLLSLWAKYSQSFQPWKDENLTLTSSLSHPENAFLYFINHRDHKADEKTQNAGGEGQRDCLSLKTQIIKVCQLLFLQYFKVWITIYILLPLEIAVPVCHYRRNSAT